MTEAAAEAGAEAAAGTEHGRELGGEGRGDAGGGRRRGRRGGEGGRRSLVPEQRPWAQPTLRMRPSEVVSEDELEVIHLASLRILRDIGMDFLDAEARRLLAEAGADVDGDGPRVRFDPDMVLERIATALGA